MYYNYKIGGLYMTFNSADILVPKGGEWEIQRCHWSIAVLRSRWANIKFLFYDLYCIIMVVKFMDNPIEFKSAKELYDRVLPALYSKVKELRGLGYKNIYEEDIWNYLVETNWKKKTSHCLK